jgi:hypothetical protein
VTRFGLYSINYAKDGTRLVEDHLGDRPSAIYAQLIQLSREQTRELGTGSQEAG